jgi:hypothetical protein
MQYSRSARALAFARARRAAQNWSDPYRPHGKLYPAVCKRCGATEWQGRWRWDEPLPDLPRVVCPACERILDGAPAHVIELTGALPPWWNEVRGMIGRVESGEVMEHPLERIMKVEVGDDRVRVATTGVHIARRLVAALVRRFRHGVRLSFDDSCTTVDWVEPRRRRA